MDREKFMLRSARVWAALTGIAGILMPFLGLDPTEGVPILEEIGNAGLALASAIFLAVHFIRPSGAAITLKPQVLTDALAAAGLVVLVLGAFVGGCVSYDPGTYYTIASTEVRALSAQDPITDAHCRSHDLAADALANREGEGTALYLPLAAGPALGDLASLHRRQAAVCRNQVQHESTGAMTGDARARTVESWRRLYSNGLALIGGDQ